jgi:hypothetical protein
MTSVALKLEPRADHGEPVTVTSPRDGLPAGLDWAAFSARCFPKGRRHDYDAIAAYFAYKQLPRQAAGRDGGAVGIEAWEDEGGSTP